MEGFSQSLSIDSYVTSVQDNKRTVATEYLTGEKEERKREKKRKISDMTFLELEAEEVEEVDDDCEQEEI
jgi:hypothetical protein